MVSCQKELDLVYGSIVRNNVDEIVEPLKKLIKFYEKSNRKYGARHGNDELQNILKYSLVHNMEVFDLLLKYIDINCYNPRGYTLLMCIIHDGFPLETIEFVISRVNDINLIALTGTSTIYLFMINIDNWESNIDEFYKTADIMLDKGADLHSVKDGLCWLPIQNKNIIMLKFILERINSAYDVLIDAIHKNYYDGVELILKYIPDINHIYKGDTALSYATFMKRTDIVELLVENGAR